jgi:hypothetical protein
MITTGGSSQNRDIYHYDVDNDNWDRLTIQLPNMMQSFSGYFDDTTQLLHIVHRDHYYMEWSKLKRSRENNGMSTTLPQWIQLFPTGRPPSSPMNSFVVDM